VPRRPRRAAVGCAAACTQHSSLPIRHPNTPLLYPRAPLTTPHIHTTTCPAPLCSPPNLVSLLIIQHPPLLTPAEDHKPAAPDERARIMAAGGFLSEIGGITRVNGNLNLSRAIGDLRYKMNAEVTPVSLFLSCDCVHVCVEGGGLSLGSGSFTAWLADGGSDRGSDVSCMIASNWAEPSLCFVRAPPLPSNKAQRWFQPKLIERAQPRGNARLPPSPSLDPLVAHQTHAPQPAASLSPFLPASRTSPQAPFYY
jgi:hypothetical protein